MHQYQIYLFKKDAIQQFKENNHIYDTSVFDLPHLAESLAKHGKRIKTTDFINEAISIQEKYKDNQIYISMIWDIKNEEWFK